MGVNAVKAENEQQDTRNQHVMQPLYRTTQKWNKYLIMRVINGHQTKKIFIPHCRQQRTR